MKRAHQISKELEISFSQLQSYCDLINLSLNNPNEKIDQETEKKIQNIHSGKIGTDELPENFQKANPFEIEFKILVHQKSKFSKRKVVARKQNESTYSTVFSDAEAFAICLGLEDRHARYIAREYFKKGESSSEHLIEAHTTSMMALEKYGDELLSYVISLPPLPFQAVEAKQIFSELDKRVSDKKFPALRVSFLNSSGKKEKLKFSFYTVKQNGKKVVNRNVIVIQNKSTGKNVMKVSRNGMVLPEANSDHVLPVIQLFVRFNADTKSHIINYGLETGECSECGRELTDPVSIKRGVGPTCAQYL